MTDFTIGYCTNVHAGVDLQAIQDNLQLYSSAIRINLGSESPLGVGLWIPAKAASELTATSSRVADFREFLESRSLLAYTINGFPYDNFHQTIVKRDVYSPPWWDDRRLDYTKQLAQILAGLLPENQRLGTISTLPVGWRADVQSESELNEAAQRLRQLATFLEKIESDTGKRIIIAIEPEPGCVIDTAEGMTTWFNNRLPDEVHRRYLSVCHDICHSAVMMESQVDVLNQYADAGIAVGKVQVSCAVVAEWDSMAIYRRLEAAEQLGKFAEDRYLHQTGRQTLDHSFALTEDLPELIAQISSESGDPAQGDKKWVVHFHVPIFLERFGHLTTSQPDVLDVLRFLQAKDCRLDFTGHLEIETYAWSVLPETMRKRGLADDITEEIRWLKRRLIDCG